jgi:hypothetical protein
MMLVRREGMVFTIGQTAGMYYGPRGGIYQVVATPEQPGNTHFAFEAPEPPGRHPNQTLAEIEQRNLKAFAAWFRYSAPHQGKWA